MTDNLVHENVVSQTESKMKVLSVLFSPTNKQTIFLSFRN